MKNLISKRFLAMLVTEIGFCFIIWQLPFAYWKDKIMEVLALFLTIFGAYLSQRWNENKNGKIPEIKSDDKKV